MELHGPADRNWLLVLDGMTDPVWRSRDFTRRALTAWHWLPAEGQAAREAAEDVMLLVSEVVANACLHGGGPGALVLDWTEERLRIEVTDANPAPPAPPADGKDPGRPGGHGLVIVDRLARAWGSRLGARGKCVWLEVPSPALSAGRPGP
ncbi:ATP-binding protein [Streptomyces sp. NBC_00091]|uniref:ATP-binding protein n=1 Tax=Streptomyces sp. NBC_00091 TaxID=2975648 RepID=UPI00225AD5C9|nr:ATP-binding protein [Streptomyces sp. NBC_00091]MCX5381550.1 ATP-binding protein [Streptomyces sp. NBC_00091]